MMQCLPMWFARKGDDLCDIARPARAACAHHTTLRIRAQSCDSAQDNLSARMAEPAEFMGGARLGEREDSRHCGGHFAGIDQRRDTRELRAVGPDLQTEDTSPELPCLLLQRFAGRRDRDECSIRFQEREGTNARVPAHQIEYEIDAPIWDSAESTRKSMTSFAPRPRT